jgi:hypothetical protein
MALTNAARQANYRARQRLLRATQLEKRLETLSDEQVIAALHAMPARWQARFLSAVGSTIKQQSKE